MGLNVVCFYWQGQDRPGWSDLDLGIEYVNKLYRGVKRNTTLPFTFTACLQHRVMRRRGIDSGITVRELASPSWKGCLPKLFVYHPHVFNSGDRIFVIDLDTVIVGNLDDLLSYDGKFATRSTFVGPKMSGGDICGFKADGSLAWIWDMLVRDTDRLEEFTGGRERFIYRKYFAEEMDYFQDLYPGQIVSYKRHVRRRGLSRKARIVSCHGKPRPHEIKESWVEEYWR